VLVVNSSSSFASAFAAGLSSQPVHTDVGPQRASTSSDLSRSILAINICGNNILEPGEECDDGNTRDFDGCSADCLLERGTCGDGVVEQALGEQCEPSTHDPSLPYGCDNTCHLILVSCGDGQLDPGEACDQGPNNSNVPGAYCRTNCSFARCGDGIVDGLQGEECDDGNRVNGDGCSSDCKRESGAGPVLGAQVYNLPTTPLPSPQPPYGQPQQTVVYAQPPVVSQTGPGSLAAMASGAAAGAAFMRRRKDR
jgi:cysteine-rich repeat protein